jgi:hypothetical protein
VTGTAVIRKFISAGFFARFAQSTGTSLGCLFERNTYEVVPVLVVELGGDGDDPSEQVRHET